MNCHKCKAETPWEVYGITGNIFLNSIPVCDLHLVGGAITAYKTLESFLGGGEVSADYVVVARQATPDERDEGYGIRFLNKLTERTSRAVWKHMVRHGISKERYPNFNSEDDFVRFVNDMTNMAISGIDDVPARRQKPVDPDEWLYTYVEKGH